MLENIDNYQAIAISNKVVVSHLPHYLPSKVNKYLIPAWNSFIIISEIKAINTNYYMGVRIKF